MVDGLYANTMYNSSCEDGNEKSLFYRKTFRADGVYVKNGSMMFMQIGLHNYNGNL